MILTACKVSVSSRLLLRHFAAACLFLSLRILFFSSSSGVVWVITKKSLDFMIINMICRLLSVKKNTWKVRLGLNYLFHSAPLAM